MAIINLDVDKIISISNELNSLDTTLLNSYVPELKDIIGQIKNNVRNEQVNSILGTISSQVDSISGELATDLPRLEQFLESQMQTYKLTEAEAEEKVNAVLQKMGAFGGVAYTTTQGGGATVGGNGGTTTTTATPSSSNNGVGLGEKMASGAVTGAVLGGVGIATGVATTMLVGTKAGAALGAVGGPVGVAIGAAAGAVIGAAAPAVINVAAKGVSVIGKGITAAGNWLDSIF